MDERIRPTVLSGGRHLGWLLLMLRTMAGWSQRRASTEYHCAASLIGLRERGRRSMSVESAVNVLGRHGYVLVVMHGDDATQLHRLRAPDLPDAAARSVG